MDAPRTGGCQCGVYEPDGFDAEIAIATLDDPRGVAPILQIGLESRLPWCESLTQLPTRSAVEAAKVAPFFDGIVSFQHPDRPDDDEHR